MKAKNIVLGFAKLLINFATPIVCLPILASRIDPLAFGELMLAQAIFFICIVFIDYGFGLNGFKRVIETSVDHQKFKICTNIVASKVFLSIVVAILFFIYFFVAGIDGSNGHAIIFLTASSLILYSLNSVWLLQLKGRFDLIFLINTVPRLISLGTIICLVKNSNDLVLAYAALILPVVASAVMSFLISKVEFKIDFCNIDVMQIFQFYKDNFYVSINTFASSIFPHGTTILLGSIVGSEEAGVFAMADKLIRSMAQTMVPVLDVSAPYIAGEIAKDRKSGLLAACRILKIGAIFFFLCGVAFFVCINTLSSLIEVYISTEVLRVMSVFSVLPLLIFVNSVIGSQMLINLGCDKNFSMSMIIAAGASLLLSVMFSGVWGASGAAFGVLCGEAILILLYYLKLIDVSGLTWNLKYE